MSSTEQGKIPLVEIHYFIVVHIVQYCKDYTNYEQHYLQYVHVSNPHACVSPSQTGVLRTRMENIEQQSLNKLMRLDNSNNSHTYCIAGIFRML